MLQLSFLRFTLSKHRDTEQQAGELRQASLLAGNNDPGVLTITDFRRGLRKVSFSELVTCLLHCATHIKWKFIFHPSVSFVIVSVCPRDWWQLASPPCWYFFQHLLLCASANIGYLPCGSLICGSVSWPKFGLLFLMNLSCWLIIYQIFMSMISLQMFFAEPSGLSLVCFSLGFAFCAVLCCRRHKRIVTPLLFQSAKSVLILAFNFHFLGQEIYEHRGEIKFGHVTLMELCHCPRASGLKEVLSNFWRRKTIWKREELNLNMFMVSPWILWAVLVTEI